MQRTALLLFVARRLAALAGLLMIISFGVFSLVSAAPGSPEQVLLGSRPANPETIQALRAQYHLDDPFLVQYGKWAQDAVTLDFGRSIRTSEPVLSGIAARTELTLFLGVYAFSIAAILGVLLGILAAVRKGTVVDRGVVALTVIGVSAPPFATGVFLLYVFAVILGWFPAFGQGDGFVDRLWHLALPAVALSLIGMGLILKLTRAGMIGALDQDYVAFARARGLGRGRVLGAYALRNTLVPILTAGGNVFGVMLTASVLVEVTFALPGVGSLLVESISFQDLPMVQGIALVVATLIVLVNLLTDVLYVFVDPRIRFGRVAA